MINESTSCLIGHAVFTQVGTTDSNSFVVNGETLYSRDLDGIKPAQQTIAKIAHRKCVKSEPCFTKMSAIPDEY